MESFQFKGYQLRPAGIGDLELARLWTAADPDHAGKVDPGFWLTQGRFAQAYLLSDCDGPVFFFKGIVRLTEAALEIHVQFPPDNNSALSNMRRRRVSQGLIEGLAWLEQRSRSYVDEIRFVSTTPALIRFCIRHLGFVQDGQTLRKRIDSEVPLKQISRAGE